MSSDGKHSARRSAAEAANSHHPDDGRGLWQASKWRISIVLSNRNAEKLFATGGAAEMALILPWSSATAAVAAFVWLLLVVSLNIFTTRCAGGRRDDM